MESERVEEHHGEVPYEQMGEIERAEAEAGIVEERRWPGFCPRCDLK
jgi:hypothetical protein